MIVRKEFLVCYSNTLVNRSGDYCDHRFLLLKMGISAGGIQINSIFIGLGLGDRNIFQG